MKNTRNPLFFVVIESSIYNNLVVGYLKSKKYKNIKSFNSGTECINNLHLNPDIIILGYDMNEMNGLEIMKTVNDKKSGIEYFFLSGQNNIETAVNLIKNGATDYIVKNDNALSKLAKSVDRTITKNRMIKARKGFKIGMIGFFIILILIIMTILSLSILFPDDFSLNIN